MFTINIYLRIAGIVASIIIGVVLTMLYGFWYAFPFISYSSSITRRVPVGWNCSVCKSTYADSRYGRGKERLNMTIFPKLLFGPGRSAYYMLKGSLAMQGKDYNEAKELFKESENSKYTTDNEKAMIYLQQANSAAVKQNYKEAAMFVKKTDDLKITEPMIRDQVKQFKQAIGKTGQMNMQNRIAAANRGGSKQGRPRMR